MLRHHILIIIEAMDNPDKLNAEENEFIGSIAERKFLLTPKQEDRLEKIETKLARALT